MTRENGTGNPFAAVVDMDLALSRVVGPANSTGNEEQAGDTRLIYDLHQLLELNAGNTDSPFSKCEDEIGGFDVTKSTEGDIKIATRVGLTAPDSFIGRLLVGLTSSGSAGP